MMDLILYGVFMKNLILSQSILWAAAVLATAISNDASVGLPLIVVCATIAIGILQREIKKLEKNQ